MVDFSFEAKMYNKGFRRTGNTAKIGPYRYDSVWFVEMAGGSKHVKTGRLVIAEKPKKVSGTQPPKMVFAIYFVTFGLQKTKELLAYGDDTNEVMKNLRVKAASLNLFEFNAVNELVSFIFPGIGLVRKGS